MPELQSEGAVRAGDALLRTSGGPHVRLRIAQPPMAGDAGEELGLATPQFGEVELGPAAFRKAGSTTVLLIVASVVDALAGTLPIVSATEVLESAAGIVVDGAVFAVTGVVAERAHGRALCYAVTLTPVYEGE